MSCQMLRLARSSKEETWSWHSLILPSRFLFKSTLSSFAKTISDYLLYYVTFFVEQQDINILIILKQLILIILKQVYS